MTTAVTEVAPALPELALAHFGGKLAFETDCWDVHETMVRGADFVLLDVRSPGLFADGHVPGAVSLPHRKISPDTLAMYPPETVFVVYCAGPHCNGADRAAARLSRLGRFVKVMIGGAEGWRNEGFELSATPASAT